MFIFFKVLNSSTTAQLITKPNVNIKCQSSMDRHVTCKVELEQLPKRRYPYPHVNKPTEPPSKPNSRQHGHSCQKHTEHIKRIHNEGISECSSGRSSQDDSCSERSTSSPRQCDCCYCEVFGHGVVSICMSNNILFLINIYVFFSLQWHQLVKIIKK